MRNNQNEMGRSVRFDICLQCVVFVCWKEPCANVHGAQKSSRDFVCYSACITYCSMNEMRSLRNAHLFLFVFPSSSSSSAFFHLPSLSWVSGLMICCWQSSVGPLCEMFDVCRWLRLHFRCCYDWRSTPNAMLIYSSRWCSFFFGRLIG